jgi:hypothetical protein
VSRVINDPHLLAIHPQDREDRDGYYRGQSKKKPAHYENSPFPIHLSARAVLAVTRSRKLRASAVRIPAAE